MSFINRYLKIFIQDIAYLIYKFLGIFLKNKAYSKKISENGNIIFISCFFIGDCLFLTPIYRELKKKHPKLHLTVILNDHSSFALLKSNPYIDNLIFVRNYFHAIFYVLKNIRLKYDILIDYSALFFWSFVFRFLRAKLRIARQNQHQVGHFLLHDFSWLHDLVVPYRGQYIVDYYAEIMEELGAAIPDRRMEIHLSPPEIHQTLLTFHLTEAAYFILHLGARNRENLWYRWPELIRWLLADYSQYTLLLTGTRQDADWLGELLSSPVFSNPRIHPLLGKTTLRELAALIARCEVFIGGDTGATHMAIALGKPAVILFGRADANLYAPQHQKVKIIFGTTDCYPCYTYEKIYSQCPYDKSACMESIPPESVIRAVAELLPHRQSHLVSSGKTSVHHG